MEGCLLLPPDRGTIIGRAIWKQRYVVLGPVALPQPPPTPLPRSSSSSSFRQHTSRVPPSSARSEEERPAIEQMCISVYKQKGNWDPILQYPLSAIQSCDIQSIQHKKPGPVVPTLVLTLKSEAAAEKQRKRRSSRTGLSSSSSAYPSSLLFRTLPDDRYSIYDWQITIQPLLDQLAEGPPQSPAITNFTNPFSRVPSGSEQSSVMGGSRFTSQQRSNIGSMVQSTRAAMSSIASPSPSLRSRRSDLSSQASSMNRPPGYNSSLPIQLPADLPSPASIQYDDQFISGWTSAQGRSSALSSHTRGSTNTSMGGTPPAPRETILDRAFQMKYIPGSDRAMKEEAEGEKMSSIARFDNLMKEAEERRKNRLKNTEPESRQEEIAAWELAEDEEDSDSDMEEFVKPARNRYNDSDIEEEDELGLSVHQIPTPAQRALEYIAGRHNQEPSPRRRISPPSTVRTPLPLLADRAPLNTSRRERPKTFNVSTATTKSTAEDDSSSGVTINAAKRLSFTEFARRLSSTSSLLLVQTNVSSGSSRNSKRSSSETSAALENDEEQQAPQRGLSHGRTNGGRGHPAPGQASSGNDRDGNKCGNNWRNSGLGVFGGEGGFL